MAHYLAKRPIALIGGLLLLVALAAGCGGTEPQARSFDLNFKHGKIALDPPVVTVNQDDEVTLRIASDQPGEFHLHGFDLDVMVAPGVVADLSFKAHATGKFYFELHPTASAEGHEHEDGHDDSHETDADACQAELPPGTAVPKIHISASVSEGAGKVDVGVDIENFILGPDSGGSGLPNGHWHLFIDGDLQGMYTQPQITVPLDTSGEHQIMATLSDNQHCDYNVHAMTAVTVEGGHEDDQEHTHEEGEDILLGSLEVHPR